MFNRKREKPDTSTYIPRYPRKYTPRDPDELAAISAALTAERQELDRVRSLSLEEMEAAYLATRNR